MKRTALILGLVAFLAYSVIAEPKQKPKPKQVVAVMKRSLWKKLLTPAKYVFAGLLRIGLDSKGEPYQ